MPDWVFPILLRNLGYILYIVWTTRNYLLLLVLLLSNEYIVWLLKDGVLLFCIVIRKPSALLYILCSNVYCFKLLSVFSLLSGQSLDLTRTCVLCTQLVLAKKNRRNLWYIRGNTVDNPAPRSQKNLAKTHVRRFPGFVFEPRNNSLSSLCFTVTQPSQSSCLLLHIEIQI